MNPTQATHTLTHTHTTLVWGRVWLDGRILAQHVPKAQGFTISTIKNKTIYLVFNRNRLTKYKHFCTKNYYSDFG